MARNMQRFVLALRSDAGALRDGRVRRLVGADLSSLTGDFMVLAAMPFAVLSIGGSGSQVGLALAAQGAGLALALPVGGVLGDRFARRSVMVGADALRFVSQGLIAILLITGEASYWQLIVGQLVHGTGTGFYMPSSTSIVPDVVVAGAVQPTNGLKTVARAIAGAGGPALGALAIAVLEPGVVLGADAVTFLVSAFLLSGLPGWTGRVATSQRSFVAELRASLAELGEGWREFRALRWMRSVTAQFAAVNALVIAPFFVFGPTLSAESLGGAGAWALILTALALGEFLGGAAAISLHPARPLVTAIVAFLAWVPALLLLSVLAPVPVIAGAAVFAGVGQAIFAVLWETTVQTHVAEGQRSRLSSLEQFGSLALVPFGFAIGGWMLEAIGAVPSMIGGAAFLAGASVLVIALPSVRQIRSAGSRASTASRSDESGSPLSPTSRLAGEGEAA
jgi:MFS family permease